MYFKDSGDDLIHAVLVRDGAETVLRRCSAATLAARRTAGLLQLRLHAAQCVLTVRRI